MKPRDDWPFGAELKRHRTARGLSVKAAARRADGVSDGRWYQLESGYQQMRGQYIPISTTPATVAAVARAVDWPINEALTVAGFDPIDLPAHKPSPLDLATDEELLAEVRKRMTQTQAGGRQQQTAEVHHFPTPKAARKVTGQSEGHRRREAQDQAGEQPDHNPDT